MKVEPSTRLSQLFSYQRPRLRLSMASLRLLVYLPFPSERSSPWALTIVSGYCVFCPRGSGLGTFHITLQCGLCIFTVFPMASQPCGQPFPARYPLAQTYDDAPMLVLDQSLDQIHAPCCELFQSHGQWGYRHRYLLMTHPLFADVISLDSQCRALQTAGCSKLPSNLYQPLFHHR